jgi:hypothetical protein
MKLVTPSVVQSRAIEILGLDSSVLDLSSPEGLAATIRRATSFSSPCSSSHVVSMCFELLTPLLGPSISRETIADALESLISYGDLYEAPDVTGNSASELIYVTPPSFVAVSSSLVLLIGIGVDGCFPIPEPLKELVQPVGHYRRIVASGLEETCKVLLSAGFLHIDLNEWMKAPPSLSSEAHVGKYDRYLVPTGVVGTLEGLRILEFDRPVHYYRGRWAPLKKQSGKFIARRPQAYGADLWCYLHVENGEVKWFVDLPVLETRWRGCDEAWHLQQAIDAMRGHPQIYATRKGTASGTVVVDLFSPIPQWARRRWDYSGEPTTASNCLLSYVFASSRVEEELKFVQERMWLRQHDDVHSHD